MTKTKFQQKKRLVYALDPDSLDDAYEFKYELSEAMDEVIESIKGLKKIIEGWMSLMINDHLTVELPDEPEIGPLPF